MNHKTLDDFRDRPSLKHLKRLTTKDGVIQHADHEVPDPSFGYSIDDNARALIACLWHHRLFQDPSVLQLAEVYFRYIERVEKDGGSFHNFLSFSEVLLDPEGSEDSIGRAIWALGETIKHAEAVPALAAKARVILERAAIAKHLEHPHVRTKAYILLGLLAAGDHAQARVWLKRLVTIFEANEQIDWPWFEGSLFYANGIFPYALAVAAKELNEPAAAAVAQKAFDWLNQVSREADLPAPIGQAGWFKRGQEKALYDQQPLEAADMVLAAVALFELTGEARYQTAALEWQAWYDGHNTQAMTLINPETGGIYDALTPGGVNKNQGAESIVTYLLAYLGLAALRVE